MTPNVDASYSFFCVPEHSSSIAKNACICRDMSMTAVVLGIDDKNAFSSVSFSVSLRCVSFGIWCFVNVPSD
jgi:hypothetical protein